jgi:hypothetical protein
LKLGAVGLIPSLTLCLGNQRTRGFRPSAGCDAPFGAICIRHPWGRQHKTLADLLDQFKEWRDKLPSSLANSATAEALDAVLELRSHVEELEAIELPKGFGRD